MRASRFPLPIYRDDFEFTFSHVNDSRQEHKQTNLQSTYIEKAFSTIPPIELVEKKSGRTTNLLTDYNDFILRYAQPES